jgi:PPM family protein phosphatase
MAPGEIGRQSIGGISMEFAVATDKGLVRGNNEDSYGVARELNLFVLSDGMGGYASGEVASKVAVDTILNHCREAQKNPSLPFDGLPHPAASAAARRLASGISLANQAIREGAQKDPSLRGMGATVVALEFHNNCVTVAHVGDSRAYRLRNGALKQLTGDHSFVADQVRRGKMTEVEAGQSNLQNVLLRALGPEPDVLVDLAEELALEGDAYLLCSDGLTKELSDGQVAGVLQECDDAREAASRLIRMANDAGGEDNITIILVRLMPGQFGAWVTRLGRWFKDS